MRTAAYGHGALFVVAAIGAGLIFLAGSGETAGGPPSLAAISTTEAEGLIRGNEGRADFVLLDVRTPREYERDHLRGAVLLDYRSKTFVEEIGRLDRTRTYLLYCASGNRSGMAMEIMRSMGFRNVIHMAGGIGKWKEEGRPVVP